MESDIQFYLYGDSVSSRPFSDLEFLSYSEDSEGMVFHTGDVDIVDDSNIHIYLRQPTLPRGNQFQLIVFERTEIDEEYPRILYVVQTRKSSGLIKIEKSNTRDVLRSSKSFDDMIFLVDFLERQFYSSDFEEDEIRDMNDPYNKFISEIERHSSGSLEEFLKAILTSMGFGESSGGTDESKIDIILAYINIFQVGFVDEDFNPDPRCNLELLEFLGDLASWKPLNEIFIEYAEKNEIELTEAVITAFHRSYASKEKQAQIAKRLRLHTFLKKKGDITIDTYEDLFESFVGSLFLVNFHIRAILSIDLRLHEVFLEWVYKSWDLSGYVEKPEITEFYEQMRVLVGTSAFKERLIKTGRESFWAMTYKPGTIEKITGITNYVQNRTVDEVAKFIEDLEERIRETYSNNEYVYELRREKYGNITNFVKTFIDANTFRRMTNDRNTAEWDEDSKNEFDRLIGGVMPGGYLVTERFTDKSKTSSYWVVYDDKDEIIYTTMGYDQGENPDTLISIIRDQEKGITRIRDNTVGLSEFDENINEYFFQDNTSKKKFFLTGNSSVIENYIMEEYTQGKGQFFLVIKIVDQAGKVGKEFLEYDPRPLKYFQGTDDEKYSQTLDYLKKFLIDSFEDSIPYKKHLPRAIHRYIGDRAAYGYTALIAVLKHQITNVYHLTEIRNFYRSKELKKELTRILDFEDNGELIPFDEALGKNLSMAEAIITNIYMHIKIESSITHPPHKRLSALRNAIFAKEDSDMRRANPRTTPTTNEEKREAEILKKREEKKRAAKAKVMTKGKSYIYESSKGVILSVNLSGFNYAKVKEAFEKYLLRHEQKNWGITTLNSIRNARFSSLPGFDSLKQLMEFRNTEEWQLSLNKKDLRKGITLSYYSNNNFSYLKGADIESLLKQL